MPKFAKHFLSDFEAYLRDLFVVVVVVGGGSG